jgi:hypothetical protein
LVSTAQVHGGRQNAADAARISILTSGRSRSKAVLDGWEPSGRRRVAMEFIIGLGIMAVIWIVVIYGSDYVNKNVQ